MYITSYRSEKFLKWDKKEFLKIEGASKPEEMTEDEREDLKEYEQLLHVFFTDGTDLFIPANFIISITRD